MRSPSRTGNRSGPIEVEDLMNLLRHYVNAKHRFCTRQYSHAFSSASWKHLAPDIQQELEDVRKLTEKKYRSTVQMAISYGARQELTTAMRRIASKVAAGKLTPSISARNHSPPTCTHRYGGPRPAHQDQAAKNASVIFLLWQSAYYGTLFHR